jgi:IclR family pca regulon transcriptional regulator
MPRQSKNPAPNKRSRFAFVQSVERGLAVIKSFDENHSEQTLSDVAKATGLDRSAARRFLLTLEALGYVEHDDKLFRLRPQTLQLGYAYLSSLPWWRSAQRVSERLTNKIGLASAIGVLDGQNVVYVAYSSTRRFPLLQNRSVGTHLPAITSAVGRVLVAGLPADEATVWLSKVKIEKYTSLTQTNRAEIEQTLADVRTSGFSIVDQELEIGLRSIGVPIRDKGGITVAGLSISILEGQITRETIVKRYLRPLQDASVVITSTLPT